MKNLQFVFVMAAITVITGLALLITAYKYHECRKGGHAALYCLLS